MNKPTLDRIHLLFEYRHKLDPNKEFLIYAKAYPGQAGLDNGSEIHGSTTTGVGLTVYSNDKLST